MDNKVPIGKILKTHGFSGEVRVFVEEPFWDDFEELDTVFVEAKGRVVPLFIEQLRGTFPDVIVSFEEYDNKESVQTFVGNEVLAREKDIKRVSKSVINDTIGYAHLEGFSLYDLEIGLVGTILEVFDNGMQDLAIVETEEGERYVPMVDELIVKIDKKAKKVEMSLPEGLFNL